MLHMVSSCLLRYHSVRRAPFFSTRIDRIFSLSLARYLSCGVFNLSRGLMISLWLSVLVFSFFVLLRLDCIPLARLFQWIAFHLSNVSAGFTQESKASLHILHRSNMVAFYRRSCEPNNCAI